MSTETTENTNDFSDEIAKNRRQKKKVEMDNTKQQQMKREVVTQLSDIEQQPFPKENQNKFLKYGTSEMQGKRSAMEDAYTSLTNFREFDGFFGVYDGHGGPDASKLVGKMLHTLFEKKLNEYLTNINEPDYDLSNLTSRVRKFLCDHENLYDPSIKDEKRTGIRRDSMVGKKNYIEDSIEDIDITLLSEEESIQLLFRETFLEMSEKIQENKIIHGTTAVVAFITEKKIYIANSGDSRAVLCRDGKAIQLSVDHRAKDDSENRRIRQVGGFVGGGRVNGIISVSRAIGDNYFEPMIIADAFTSCYEIDDKVEFLILACDGVFDVVDNDKAVEIIRDEKDPRLASTKLRDYAYKEGSTDNISCTVIRFEKQ